MIAISIANTDSDKQKCYELRYDVFVDQYHYLQPNKNHAIIDRFDNSKNNFDIIAKLDDKIIGSLRVSIGNKDTITPPEEIYNFKKYLNDEKYCSASMLCVSDGNKLIAGKLVQYLFLFSYIHHIEYVIATINPRIIKQSQSFTMHTIDKIVMDEKKQLEGIPMLTSTYDYLKYIKSYFSITKVHPDNFNLFFYRTRESLNIKDIPKPQQYYVCEKNGKLIHLNNYLKDKNKSIIFDESTLLVEIT